MRISTKTFRAALPALCLLAVACGGLTSADLTGVWISADTTSRVEFFPEGRATVGDPLNTLAATWAREKGVATIGISDTTGAPLQIIVEKSGANLVLRIDTDTVRYSRANPQLEAAFKRISNNEAINAMTNDLMALKDAQNTIHQLAKAYSKAFPMGFQPSNSVAIVVTGATATAWSAVATHPAARAKCAIAVGGGANGMVSCN